MPEAIVCQVDVQQADGHIYPVASNEKATATAFIPTCRVDSASMSAFHPERTLALVRLPCPAQRLSRRSRLLFVLEHPVDRGAGVDRGGVVDRDDVGADVDGEHQLGAA